MSYTILVDTSADTVWADGLCSLREAIIASNLNNGGYYDCVAGTTGTDRIVFDDSLTVINVNAALPTITAPVEIKGHSNGTRMHLHGPGSTAGLTLDTTAGGSIVRNMYIENFETGIWSLAASVTIKSNWIGPNTLDGVSANGANTIIGGTNTLDPSNPCSGDCNLIKGNTRRGLYLNSSGTVTGNFIGIDALGSVATAATANGTGIGAQGDWAIGGAASGQGNVISGNVHDGIQLTYCSCTIQGNHIGTNLAGTAAVPNGEDGVQTNGTTTIGGPSDAAGNIISGNGDDGVEVSATSGTSSSVLIYGNLIGTTISGSALGNGDLGINIGAGGESVSDVVIGAPSLAGSANVIANSKGTAGIHVGQHAKYVEIRGNSIHDNAPSYAQGIFVLDPGNEGIQRPVIEGLGPLHGTACANCTVDVYSDSADEGRIYEGVTTADGSGNWSFGGTLTGPKVTATATNATHSTSMFSTPYTLPSPKKPDGRIRKGSGSFIGNNIYNTTGANQTKSGTTTRGNTITFGIQAQNDATTSDSFKLAATGTATTMYTVTYFRGTTDITAAVVAGTYTTSAVAPGDKFLIKARVRVNNTATVGSSVTRLLTITSVGDPTRKDAVKLIGKRS